MENLEEIYKYFQEPTTILIINNHSTKVLDSFFDIVYNKTIARKINIKSRKGLFYKLMKIKNKLIKIDFELDSVQFSSSKTKSKIFKDFIDIKESLTENNSKLLCRTDVRLNKKIEADKIYNYYLTNIFQLIIFIDKEEIKLIKHKTESCRYYNDSGKTFNITKLVRGTKIKKLSNLFK